MLHWLLRFVAPVLLGAMILGTGWQVVPRAVQAQAPTEGGMRAGMVFQMQIKQYNSGDLDAEVGTFTDTAVLVGPAGCTLATPCVGKDAIRAALSTSIADHSQATILTLQEAGSTVSGQLELRSDRISAAGSERALFSYLVQVQGGLVAASTRMPDLTDPQTVAFLAAQA